MKTSIDETWIADFHKGKESAFRMGFDKYYKALYFFAFKILKDEIVAKDLVQEIFINLWKSRESITSETHLRLFLYQAVRRRCLNWFRDRKAETKFRQEFHELSDDADFTDKVVEAEIQRVVLEEILSLPAEQRKVIELHLAGKDNIEIAEIMDISINTVRTHKSRARKTLKEHFDYLFVFLFYTGL